MHRMPASLGPLALLSLLPLLFVSTGCLHERPPSQLRGEIAKYGAHFIVTECSTHRTYELKLVPAAHVALERHVRETESEQPGPVLVELGGKTLVATAATSAEAIFDVHERYSVRAGTCP